MTACSSYDEVPYASYPYPESHPDRLAVVAALLGLPSPPVEHCRVLELGSASGGNLIPMAEALPQSSFLGIDLSERQIALGSETIRALGLTNIELRRMNITEVGPGLGVFDYILCHGVYSWVPPAVQDHILTVCRQNLAPQGIAYVSYNTLPGWHLRGTLRDLMLLHSRAFAPASKRVEQARALLHFLAQSVAEKNSPYPALLRSEVERLQGKDDDYLLHEFLDEHNQPCYFFQFVERAMAKGLRYLGDTDVHLMVPNNLAADVTAQLHELSAELLQAEQYVDLLRNRMFRRTLLCHAERPSYSEPRPEPLTTFWVAAPLRPASPQCALDPATYEKFHGLGGAEIASRKPIVKAALRVLAEAWPQALPFAELQALARAQLPGGPMPDAASRAQDTQQLGPFLLRCYATASTNLVELAPRPLHVAKQAGDRPRARLLARWQATVGPSVTNLRHQSITLGAFARQLVRHLDGQHDHAALLEILEDLVSRHELTVQLPGPVAPDRGQLRALLRDALEKELGQLVRHALLLE